MSSQEEIKKIERRARALLTSKEIPPHKQEVVRTLMNNRQLKPGEKYRAIIELVQSCPDKKTVLYRDEGVRPEPAKKKKTPPPAEARKPGRDRHYPPPRRPPITLMTCYRKYRAVEAVPETLSLSTATTGSVSASGSAWSRPGS